MLTQNPASVCASEMHGSSNTFQSDQNYFGQ